MKILAPHLSCVVNAPTQDEKENNEFDKAIAEGYQQIYVVGPNGIVKYHKLRGENRYVTVKVNAIPNVTFLELQQDITNFLPAGKVPLDLFRQVEAFFRQVMAVHKNALEAMIWVLYSKERGYFLHVPNQRISKAAVSYDWGDIPEGASIIVDIHSHNTMGAFFSGTDNNDDSSSIRISGVFGNLQNSTPSTVWRFNYLNQKFDLKLEDIFEEPKKEELELPKEWLSRVAVSTPTVYPINRYVGTGGKQARNTTTRGRGIGTIVHGLEEMEDITRPTARSTKGHSGKEYALSMDVESNTHVTPAQGDLAFDDLDDAGLWMFAGDPVARMVTQQNSFLYGQDAAAQAARRAAWEKAVGTSPENPQELESAEEAIEREAHIEDEVREVRRVHVVDGDDEGPPVGRGGLYEVHAIEYGTEIADAYDSIDTEMVMLEGQDELLGALSSDMVGLIKDDAVKLDLMRSLYNSIGSEGREKLMSTGF